MADVGVSFRIPEEMAAELEARIGQPLAEAMPGFLRRWLIDVMLSDWRQDQGNTLARSERDRLTALFGG